MEHGLNIAILVVGLAQLGLIVVLAGALASKVRDIREQFAQFVSPVSEGQASPLAGVAETVSDMVARSIMAQAKMTFAGLSSGVVRQEAAIDGDIAEGLARMNPVVDGVLKSFPALRKTLRKNPALVDMAIAKLAERFGVNGGAPGNGPGVARSQTPPAGGKISG